MPSFVKPDACDACANVHEGPLCVYICPNDLMVLDSKSLKAFNQEADMCSECYACVKMCPQEAIEVRGYADFIPMGAVVQPRKGELEISWTVTFRDGRSSQYTYPVRTTRVGSSEAYKGFAEPSGESFNSLALAGEEIWLGVPELPGLKKQIGGQSGHGD